MSHVIVFLDPMLHVSKPKVHHVDLTILAALDGGCPCRLSILRNANVACLCRLFIPMSPV